MVLPCDGELTAAYAIAGLIDSGIVIVRSQLQTRPA
jgi:hypothetical protein